MQLLAISVFFHIDKKKSKLGENPNRSTSEETGVGRICGFWSYDWEINICESNYIGVPLAIS